MGYLKGSHFAIEVRGDMGWQEHDGMKGSIATKPIRPKGEDIAPGLGKKQGRVANPNVAALLYTFDKGVIKDEPLRDYAKRMPRVLTCDQLDASAAYTCWACGKVRQHAVQVPQPCKVRSR